MEFEVRKGDLLFQEDGCQFFTTNDNDLTVMEWVDRDEAELAIALHTMLKEHALCTNFVGPLGFKSCLVHHLEPLPFTVIVNTTKSDAQLQFVLANGTVVDQSDLAHLAGLKQKSLDTVLDCSLHTARCLRAHLLPQGEGSLRLHLTFGIAPSGECQMQMLSPSSCDLGSADYASMVRSLHKH